jgi:hypothetical protein
VKRSGEKPRVREARSAEDSAQRCPRGEHFG